MENQEWISASEAAKRCGVSPAAVHGWREKKLFTKLLEKKSPTGRIVYWFPADEVDRMARELKPVVVGA